jgi:branched-chain amino acid aminotransferase
MLNERGEVAEGASSNLFIVRQGALVTPPLSAGILPGITRDVIVELAPTVGIPVREETLLVPDLYAAAEMFITSTLKEAAPVRSVDGRLVGDGRPGPVTLKVLQAFREYARRHCA